MTPNIEEISQETQEHVHPEYSIFCDNYKKLRRPKNLDNLQVRIVSVAQQKIYLNSNQG